MIEIFREERGYAVPIYDCHLIGYELFGLMSDSIGRIAPIDKDARRAYLTHGIIGTPPENDAALLDMLGIRSELPEGEYEGKVFVNYILPNPKGETESQRAGSYGVLYLKHTELEVEAGLGKVAQKAKMVLKITNRQEGRQRVALVIDDLVWNEITGPTAVAVSQLLEAKPTFDEREMAILKAIFSGECSGPRLQEGGDYTYDIWNQGMTRDEMNRFLGKLG